MLAFLEDKKIVTPEGVLYRESDVAEAMEKYAQMLVQQEKQKRYLRDKINEIHVNNLVEQLWTK